MTPEERERYVSQDEVKRGYREIPASDRLERLDGRETMADLFRPGGYLSEQSPLYAQLDPMGVECLRMFYGEGKTCGQIAKRMSVQYLVGKRVVKTTGFTKNMAKKLLRSTKKALLRLYRENQED